MVFLNTTQDIVLANQSLVRYAAYVNHELHPDTTQALAQANLRSGESVLEIGSGSGRLIASAKQQVGGGFCVAVDATPGYLQENIPWQLQQQGLAAHPQGTPDNQVHLLHANATDETLRQQLRTLPGAPQTFDCIFILHVLNTTPPGQRQQVLVTLRRLLTPGTGRLVATMSGQFTPNPPVAAEQNMPVQFRTSDHTECPSALLKIHFSSTARVLTPAGQLHRKDIHAAVQLVPNRLFAIADQQARAAAEAAGLYVKASFPVGKGDNFGLQPNRQSPSDAAIQSMGPNGITNRLKLVQSMDGQNCIGRMLEYFAKSATPTWHSLPSWRQDFELVRKLQQLTLGWEAQVEDANTLRPQPAGVHFQKMTWVQLGTMLVLGKD